MADKIVVLNGGHIEQVGRPLDLYNHPRNRFVAGFIGSPKMNFLDGHVETVADDHTTIRVCGEAINLARPLKNVEANMPVTMGIRPEHLKSEEGWGEKLADLRVDLVENLGDETLLYTRSNDGQQISMALSGQQSVINGTSIPAYFNANQCHIFNPQGMAL